MSWKSLSRAALVVALSLGGTAASVAQSAQPRFEVAQADARRHAHCDRIPDRRERQRCFNGPGKDNADLEEAIGLGLFGLALGAILAGAASDADEAKGPTDRDRWLAYCYDKYRSFDPRTGTYVGRDGRRHRCR